MILTMEQIGRLLAGEALTIEGIEIKLAQDEPNCYATGAEIKDFWYNGWDKDYYYECDDAMIQITDEEGEWTASDSRVYDLRKLGPLYWQGVGEAKYKGKEPHMSFENAFNAWKKSRAAGARP